MKEILPDIFTWTWFSQPHGYDFNGHLIRHRDGNLCIDPVQPDDAVLAEMAAMGVAKSAPFHGLGFGAQVSAFGVALVQEVNRAVPLPVQVVVHGGGSGPRIELLRDYAMPR